MFLDIGSFFFVFLITLLFVTLVFFKKKNLKKTSIFEKIFTVITGYLFIPILLAIPYYLILNNLSLFDAYFESVSGFTSTGFTVFENLKHLNSVIQKAARLRIGKPSTKVIAACRKAVKKNNIGALLQIISTGEAPGR